jgi:hypothetical protein
MGTRIKIAQTSLGDVRPYGWEAKKDTAGTTNNHGHEFELVVTLKFEKFLSTGRVRMKSADDEHVLEWPQAGNWGALEVLQECKQMPLLEWRENIRFYDVNAGGGWTYMGEYDVDMFAHAPRAKTFGGLYPGIAAAGGNGWCDPWTTAIANPGMRTLTTLAKPKGFDKASVQERFALTALLFRDKNKPLDAIATDRPGMTKNPSGGKIMGGGGLEPKTSSSSRVRVIHFRLGFAGSGITPVMVTQILETQNGVPTICKFVNRRMDNREVENIHNHANWRAQLHLSDYNHPDNHNLDA